MNTILIVEDSRVFGQLLRSRLQEHFSGYVVWARNYQQAVAKIAEARRPFAFAILDLHLPDAPNGEVVKFVLGQNIPCVVLTGVYQGDLRERMLAQGVLDFFVKDNAGVIDSVVHFIDRIKKNRAIQVLVVDDSRAALQMITQILRRYGFIVLIAESGAQALEQIKGNHIQLVITDYEMPGMDGVQLTQAIRADHTRNEMIVLGLSSKTNRDLAVQFIKAGANDFLTKPFQNEELFWRVTQNLEILDRNAQLDILVERNRAILANALDAIVTTDRHGVVVDFNPSAEQLFGFTRAEMIGCPFVDVLVPPEGRRRKWAWLRWQRNNEQQTPTLKFREELSGLRADGKTIDLEVSLVAVYHKGGRYFTAFLHDITDRKQFSKSLKETLDVAEAASRVKSDFVANMSHEIRTPMNAIIGFNELACHADVSPVVRRYLEKANNAAHALMGILDDILDFSKLEANKMELDAVAFQLHEVFDQLADLFVQQTTEKGLELILAAPADFDHTLHGDRQRLGQVLINLIRNAIKFTDQGVIVVKTRVTRIGPERVKMAFEVVDTGIGIPPGPLSQLFKPFVQADSSITRRYGGTGLGLAICKQLVTAMGGHIGVTSTPGQGSIFFFDVPFVCQPNVSKKQLILPERWQGLKVLLVEDSALSRKIVGDMLRTFGADPCAVATGEQAVADLQTAMTTGRSYDLVILDWQLPGMDGMATAASINAYCVATEPPAVPPRMILITAFGKEATWQQAKEVGVNLCLSKPVSQVQLFRAILEVFGERPIIDQPGHLLTQTVATKKLAGARILLVDDNVINQEIASELLMRVGLVVAVANNGKEAVDMVQESVFDAVLMDVQMPEMNGMDAARLIRRDSRFQKLPIIAMTAHVMEEERRACLEAGMNAHLAKPIRPERLYGVLSEWLGPLYQPVAVPQQDDIPFIPAISGIDTTDGLQRLAGNRTLYRQLLLRFRQGQSHIAAAVSSALEQGDIATVQHLVHAVKGVAGNIGAIDFYQVANELEKALKCGDKGTWSQLHVSFTASLTAILDALNSLEGPEESLEQRRGVAPTMRPRAAQRPADTARIVPLLKELVKKLKGNSLDTDELLITLSELVKATPAEPAMQELARQMENYEFQKALVALDELAAVLGISRPG